MKILLDTHIFLWLLAEPEKLSSHRMNFLESSSHEVFLSAVSIAELMIKASIGKIDFPYNPLDLAREAGLELLNFCPEDALELKNLPFHHKDPFDRMLICQSLIRGIPLMSDDTAFSLYGCRLI